MYLTFLLLSRCYVVLPEFRKVRIWKNESKVSAWWFAVTTPTKNWRYGSYVQQVHQYHSYISIHTCLKSTGSTEFFSAFATKSLAKERLASLFSKKFWRRNEQLLVEGTPAKELHVVAQGDVSIILGGKACGGLFFFLFWPLDRNFLTHFLFRAFSWINDPCTKLFACSNLQWCWPPDNLSTFPWQQRTGLE